MRCIIMTNLMLMYSLSLIYERKSLSFHFLISTSTFYRARYSASYETYTINQSYQCQQHTKFCFDDTYSDKRKKCSLNDLTTTRGYVERCIRISSRIFPNKVQTRIIPFAFHGKKE